MSEPFMPPPESRPADAIVMRTGTTADAALLARLAESMFRDAFAATNDAVQMDRYCREHYGEGIQRAELASSNIRVLFFEEDGKPVAYTQMRLGAPESEIWRFYVDRAQHGRGLAQRMMAACLDTARAAGAERVTLAVWEHNPRAIAFYRKAGFEVTGTRPFILGTEEQSDFVMTRALR